MEKVSDENSNQNVQDLKDILYTNHVEEEKHVNVVKDVVQNALKDKKIGIYEEK